MTRTIFILIFSTILFLSCSKKNIPTPKSTAQYSVRTVDSLAQSTPTKSEHLLTYEQRQGKIVYMKFCSVCHGDEGKGDGFNAYNLDPKPRNFSDVQYMNALSDERLVETISEGGRGVNKSPLMPSWGGRLKKEAIEYVVQYLHSLRSEKK